MGQLRDIVRGVSATGILRIEIDGRAPTVEALQRLALAPQGHFTAAQVRGRCVRGLELHLARLDAASRELFGIGLDGDRVCELVVHALDADFVDASLRVIVFAAAVADDPSVLVTLRAPASAAVMPQRLRSVRYQRALPHIKHISSFDWSHHQQTAERDGYDGVLLTDHDGVVSEAGIANVGFLAGGEILWPDAPALQGITMQLVEPRLAKVGLPTRRGRVQLADIASFDAAFVTNARGIAPVGSIDETQLPVDPALMASLDRIYADVPWDPLER